MNALNLVTSPFWAAMLARHFALASHRVTSLSVLQRVNLSLFTLVLLRAAARRLYLEGKTTSFRKQKRENKPE